MKIKIIRRLAYFVNNIKVNCNSKNVKVKHNCYIRPGATFEGDNRISDRTYFNGHLGRYSYIGQDSVIDAYVGKFCSIGPYVRVIGGNHPTSFASTSPVFFSTFRQCGKTFVSETKYKEVQGAQLNGINYGVLIGNDVWIGDSVLIKAGIKIGDGAIVGMGAVVTKDIPAYAIVGGNPAKIIRYRFNNETIENLSKSEWWNWEENILIKKAAKIQNIEDFLYEG